MITLAESAKDRVEFSPEEMIEHYGPTIRQVASAVAKDYPMWPKEDIEQELYAFVLKRGKTIPRIGESKKFSVKIFLTRVARMEAFSQKRQVYIPNQELSYSIKQVREILWSQFDHDLWDVAVTGETIEDRVAIHSDVAWALDRLKPGKKAFIYECYASGELPKSNTKEYGRLNSALAELTNILNSYTRSDEAKSIGRRTVISNAAASAIIDSDTYKTKNGRHDGQVRESN